VNTCVEGKGFSLTPLEEISKAAGAAMDSILDYLARSIIRVVVNHKDFPLDRSRDVGGQNAVQSLLQAYATVISAKNDRDHPNVSFNLLTEA
jgi:hypothetical protein